MRHRVYGRKLNRDHNHRQALFKNLVTSLIEHGSIQTTKAKAKSVQSLADKLMTKAKVGDLHNRRMIGRVLNRRSLVHKLVDEIAPQTGERTSGFTRIVKLGTRRGDQAEMVRLEWVDTVAATIQVEAGSKKTTQPKATKIKADAKTSPAKPRSTKDLATKQARSAKQTAVAAKPISRPNTTNK